MRPDTLASEALDLLHLAALAVDGDGRLLYCNATAAELLRQGTCLVRRSSRLGAREPRMQEALRGLIRRALAGARAAVLLGPCGAANTLFAVSSPCRVRGTALLFIANADAARSPPILSQLFGLTPAEARLAHALMGGKTLDQQAAAAGLSLATVRTQLRHVLAKTGTRRQAELVRLLASLPVLRESVPAGASARK